MRRCRVRGQLSCATTPLRARRFYDGHLPLLGDLRRNTLSTVSLGVDPPTVATTSEVRRFN